MAEAQSNDTQKQSARLKKLRALGILQDTSEPALDNLAELAAKTANAAFAAISFTSDKEQICKAVYGWDIESVPRNQSPCAMVCESGEPMISEDAAGDDRINTLAPIAEGGLRFYAGYPIHLGGQPIA